MSATPKRYRCGCYYKDSTGQEYRAPGTESEDGEYYRVEDVAPIVNAHDALVEVMRAAEAWSDYRPGAVPGRHLADYIRDLEVAIAKAKEVL